MGAKKHAPQEHYDQRQQTAPQDHRHGRLQVRGEIADEPLQKKGPAHCHAEILEQHDARLHVKARIKILQIQANQNGEDHHEDAHEAAIVEEVGNGIHLHDKIGGQDKRRSNQQDIEHQQRQHATGNENAK